MKTELIRVDPSNISLSESQLERAASIIRDGGLVIFPTETVYGLGADATSAAAAGKIYAAKGRPSDNPLIIHIAEPSEAEKYAYTNALYYRLAELYMPGPLTVILESKPTIPHATRAGLDTVAIRCPSHPIANRLIALSGTPIAAPSANLSGSPSPTAPSHVIDDMMGRVDMIIDGGECDFGLESTIVKIDDGSSMTLLRPGKITAEELSLVADLKIADAVTDKLKEGERVLSPGMKYRHYAPKAPVVLLDGDDADAIKYIRSSSNGKICVICYNESRELYASALPEATLYTFGDRDDELTQAHSLFAILREADACDFDVIYAPLPRKSGIGLALYNRMIRAAAHTIINLRR